MGKVSAELLSSSDHLMGKIMHLWAGLVGNVLSWRQTQQHSKSDPRTKSTFYWGFFFTELRENWASLVAQTVKGKLMWSP